MKAVIYTRVSTAAQAQEGVSLEMQQQKLRAWAALNDAEVVGVFSDEGVSGKTANREGLQAALTLAKKTKAALCVYSLSRLSRSTVDTLRLVEELTKAGCEFVSLGERLDTSSAAGRVVLRVLAALAEFEREQIGERTRAAILHLKAEGRRYGAVPHGFRDDGGKLVKDAREREVVELAQTLRAEGMSLRQISAALASRGAFNREGKPFAAKSVRSLLAAA